MAKIFPFRGIRYNKAKIKNLSKVMSPPYDIVSPSMQEFYYQLSDFNVIKLILGKEFTGDTQYNNRYVRSAASFEGWLRHNVMITDEKPAIYIYEQRFTVSGKKYVRLGFIALLRLEDMGRGKVFPHEETLSKPKLDRIELIRATHANFDSIFMMYSDEKDKVIKILKKFMRKKPTIEAKDQQKVVHRLWVVNTRGAINRIMAEMRDKSVFIADGHHRYEAAQRFKNEMKERNTRFSEEEYYNHVMVYLTPMEGSGLLVFPIHRLVKPLPALDLKQFEEELKNYFDIMTFPFSKRSEPQVRKKVLRELGKRQNQHALVMLLKEAPRYYLLTLKNEELVDVLVEEEKPSAWKHLDVTILHTIIMNKILSINNEEQINYTKDAGEAAEGVLSGPYQLAFLLNPTKVPDIITIAGEYVKMPQKSTYFYPKLLSGLVMNRIELGEKVEY